MLVCALGDLLLDVIVRLDGPLAAGDDSTARTTLVPGGQAANVAAWAADLGAGARIVAVRSGGDVGAIVERELARRGVDVCGPGGDRTMASDRGAAPTLRPQDLESGWLSCDVLHLSGYALMREPIASAAVQAAAAAREGGARVSADLSSWTHVERYGGTMRPALESVAPDIVFGNEREWQSLGGFDATTRIVKRGASGIAVDGVEHAARPAAVVDTTGAGDALAAGFLVGGTELALDAAARCV